VVLSQDNAARLEPTCGTRFSAPLRHPRRSSRSESARMRIRKRAGAIPGTRARSCIAAEWTTTFNSRPSVSTRICRLRPVTFLAASKPCGSSVEPPFEPLWRFDCR